MAKFKEYEKMWQEGNMPIQQRTKELIEKGILSADLDYKSPQAAQLAIKYDQEQIEKAAAQPADNEKLEAEKRKILPPLEIWLGTDLTAREVHEMGYSYLDILELAYSL